MKSDTPYGGNKQAVDWLDGSVAVTEWQSEFCTYGAPAIMRGDQGAWKTRRMELGPSLVRCPSDPCVQSDRSRWYKRATLRYLKERRH